MSHSKSSEHQRTSTLTPRQFSSVSRACVFDLEYGSSYEDSTAGSKTAGFTLTSLLSIFYIYISTVTAPKLPEPSSLLCFLYTHRVPNPRYSKGQRVKDSLSRHCDLEGNPVPLQALSSQINIRADIGSHVGTRTKEKKKMNKI